MVLRIQINSFLIEIVERVSGVSLSSCVDHVEPEGIDSIFVGTVSYQSVHSIHVAFEAGQM